MNLNHPVLGEHSTAVGAAEGLFEFVDPHVFLEGGKFGELEGAVWTVEGSVARMGSQVGVQIVARPTRELTQMAVSLFRDRRDVSFPMLGSDVIDQFRLVLESSSAVLADFRPLTAVMFLQRRQTEKPVMAVLARVGHFLCMGR